MTLTVVVAEAAPDAVPVTVMTYDPAGVPGLVGVEVWLLPPHPERNPVDEMSAMTQVSNARRLRAGIKRRTAASRTPARPKPPRTTDGEAAVEVIVRFDVTAPVPETVTDELESAQAIGSLSPAGEEVTLQVRATGPLKPPDGVIEMTAEFPVVAPGATVMEPLLLRAMAGVTGVMLVTVTVEVVVLMIVPLTASVPVTVIT